MDGGAMDGGTMEDGDGGDHEPGLAPETLEEAGFATVRRGYDPRAVRTQLSEAAAEIRRLNALAASLSERISELEDTPSAKLESGRVAEALGDEAARVLQTAREAAQTRIDQAEAERDRMISEAKATAAAIVDESRTEGRGMVVEARNVRERILADLAARRHEHRVAVEQLRVMRDRFMEALTISRRGLDGWIEELDQAEPQAVAAAERAGQRVAAEHEPTVGEIEAEIKAGRLVGLPLGDESGRADSGEGAPADDEPGDAGAEAGQPDDGFDLEDLDESEELDEYVEIVGYAGQPSVLGPVGLYDVEAEPDAAYAAEPGAEPVHAGQRALADAGPADAEPAAGADAEAIFARLRSITDRSIYEPAGSRGAAPVAGDLLPDQDAGAHLAGTAPVEDSSGLDGDAGTQPDVTEAGDLVSAARAVAVGGIARRLKRLVVDEQGSLLDGIRRSGTRAVRGTLSADAGHYARAVRAPMQDFASDIDVSIDDIDLAAAGEAVLSVLVEPVRSRLGEMLEEIDDPDELSTAVRSIYRETRSRLAAEAAEAAFAAGWPEPVS